MRVGSRKRRRKNPIVITYHPETGAILHGDGWPREVWIVDWTIVEGWREKEQLTVEVVDYINGLLEVLDPVRRETPYREIFRELRYERLKIAWR